MAARVVATITAGRGNGGERHAKLSALPALLLAHDLRRPPTAERSAVKPKPFKIFSCSQASPDNREHWIYMMEIGEDELTVEGACAPRTDYMRHAPGAYCTN
jgi:hypothetical protein